MAFRSATHVSIDTPRGTVIQVGTYKNDGSLIKMKAELVWNPGFGPAYTRKFGKTQMFIDEKVLRGMEPYTPLRTGMLIKSARLGTTIGSGLIRYLAPYARAQYYGGRLDGSSTTGGWSSTTAWLRGRLWFSRWKAEKKDSLMRSVRSFMRSQNG